LVGNRTATGSKIANIVGVGGRSVCMMLAGGLDFEDLFFFAFLCLFRLGRRGCSFPAGLYVCMYVGGSRDVRNDVFH
jgi:hypothetical protein